MIRTLVRALAAAALVLPLSAHAAKLSTACGPAPGGAICPDGAWFAFASLAVEVTQGAVQSRYSVDLGAGRDIRVTIDEVNPRYRGRGEAVLIDGSQLAVKSNGSLPSTGPDLLNDPLVAAQEVASLLQIALPKGPRSASKAMPVRASGQRILAASTPTMSSYHGPPWSMQGRVTPGRNGEVAFDFTLTSRIALPDGSIRAETLVQRYVGRASYPAKRPRLADTLSLDGYVIDTPNGPLSYPTLGDARRDLGVAPPN